MSLDLINVGAEPNDGTGDPPRVAGQKINANFQALQGALVATETTAQLNARDTANRDRNNHTGTQPTSTIAGFAAEAAAAAPVQSVAGRTGAVSLTRADVGLGAVDNTADAAKPISVATQAALDLKLEAASIASFETTAQLNARDTANRARANHTGTQPASTISGLAAVATSGAYGDLSGRPTITYGFTYDQQSEPVGPASGATWRERNSGGNIVGDWEWDSALSVWTDIRPTYIYHSQDVNIAAGAAGDRYRTSSPLIFIPDIKRIVLLGWALSVVTPTAVNPSGSGGAVNSTDNYRGFLPTTTNSNNAGVTFPSFAVSTQGLDSAAGASAILTASGKEIRTLSEGLSETLFRGLGFITTAVNGGIVGTPPALNNCRATYKIKFVRG